MIREVVKGISEGGKHHPENRVRTIDRWRGRVPGFQLRELLVSPRRRESMSERVDRFCDGLRERLNAIEARVLSAKANIQALSGKAEKAVQAEVEEARAKLQGQKPHIEKTRADLLAWAEQKKAETQAMIREWKAKREVQKLNARAERAEAYAEAAVVYALASIDEAEEAILDAVGARMDADAAK